MVSDTDAELVERSLNGDSAAFEALVATHIDRARAVARTVLGRDPAVDDVVQEAFLLAYRRLGELTDGRCFPSWLRRIVHNQAVTWLRRLSRSRTIPLSTLESQSDFAIEAAPAESLEDIDEKQQTLAKLDEALGQMRPAYREILSLRYQADLSYDEIAETLGTSPANVEKKLYRARQALLKLME